MFTEQNLSSRFDVVPDEVPHWYAVYTKPHHEKRVAESLTLRQVDLFCPLYHSTRRWNNGCRVNLALPLFPGYVFVRIPIRERIKVLDLASVLSIVGTSRGPAPLPDTEIECLRRGLPLINAEPHPVLTVGEKVRVCHGPLAGMSGVVAHLKNRFRVVLTLELIMRSVAVEVSANDVVPIAHDTPNVMAAYAR
jgi:transcription antitermination factor NusG